MQKNNPEIAACCETDGTVTEVLRNNLRLENSLAAGQSLAGIAGANSRPKMVGFIRKVVDSGAALDWELEVASQRGILSLFFSGCRTNSGIVIIGCAKSRSAKEVEFELMQLAGKERDRVCGRRAKPRSWTLSRTRQAASSGQELTRSNTELPSAEQQVVQKTLDLEEQKIETFRNLGMVVHALRNPANGILAAAEYLIEDSSSGVGEEGRPLLESVIRSSQYMLQIIDEILDFSASECGKLKINLRPTDLVSLVEHDLFLNTTQLQFKKLQLNKSWEQPAIIVNLDAVKITQAIDSLIHNAIKFSPNGGRIDIRLATNQEIVTLSVRDEGPGLSAGAVDTIFEPFRSSLNGSPSMKGGAGLGLAVSKRIIEAHGGEISVKNELGTGSTFLLTLPVTAPQSHSATPAMFAKTVPEGECARHYSAGSGS